MVTRRDILRGLAAAGAGMTGLAGYAFGLEPRVRLRLQTYSLRLPQWPVRLQLKATVIADLHAGEPHMPLDRIRGIVDRANAIEPDVHLLLGDYQASNNRFMRPLEPRVWAAELGRLKAPLGVHAVLGNHDWWDDYEAQLTGRGPVAGRRALEANGIAVYENDAVRLEKGGQPFWLAGLGDQLAIGRAPDPGMSRADRFYARARIYHGVDDLPGTMARIKDDAPVILMAHEPDIFAQAPRRPALTISGHTHGGQVRLAGFSPVVPSRFGNRYAYGHIVEEGRHLVVSGGLGCSIIPMRFGVPPEIVLLDIRGATA